jgi:hypothetical protein
LKFPPGAPTAPPLGVYVPLVLPDPATVPADPIEKDITKDLEVSTDEIVILPADAAEPRWVDFTGDETAG